MEFPHSSGERRVFRPSEQDVETCQVVGLGALGGEQVVRWERFVVEVRMVRGKAAQGFAVLKMVRSASMYTLLAMHTMICCAND